MTTGPIDALELDPSVCYRHPGRQSWTLCSRCGRTICPECQIGSPSGIQCPDCVRELGGQLAWRPAVAPPARTKPKRASRVRARVLGDADGPVISRGVLIVTGVLWVLGFVLQNIPYAFLAAIPGTQWQVWRFVTAAVVYPSSVQFAFLLNFGLGLLFFWLSAPMLERLLGRAQFIVIFLLSAVGSNAAALLAGQSAYGLFGPLFGLFGALLVVVWGDARVRMQILGMLAFNLVLNLLLSGGYALPAMVGGLAAGAGTTWVLRSDRPGRGLGSPRWILGGGAVALVVATVLRGLLTV